MKPRVVYIDMDGVLADFMSSALGLWGCGKKFLQPGGWPAGKKGAHQAIGVESHQFWGKITKAGINFWVEINACPWAQGLWDMFDKDREKYQTFILSSPPFAPHALAGKMIWLNEKFGPNFRQYIFTPHKHLLAAKGRLLIDDFEENCQRFEEAGGTAFLWPAPWNVKGRFPCRDDIQELLSL